MKNYPQAPTELVITSTLKKGFTPCFFLVASEKSRDVAESYAHKHVGTLSDHPFEGSTISELLGLENLSMWGTKECHNI